MDIIRALIWFVALGFSGAVFAIDTTQPDGLWYSNVFAACNGAHPLSSLSGLISCVDANNGANPAPTVYNSSYLISGSSTYYSYGHSVSTTCPVSVHPWTYNSASKLCERPQVDCSIAKGELAAAGGFVPKGSPNAQSTVCDDDHCIVTMAIDTVSISSLYHLAYGPSCSAAQADAGPVVSPYSIPAPVVPVAPASASASSAAAVAAAAAKAAGAAAAAASSSSAAAAAASTAASGGGAAGAVSSAAGAAAAAASADSSAVRASIDAVRSSVDAVKIAIDHKNECLLHPDSNGCKTANPIVEYCANNPGKPLCLSKSLTGSCGSFGCSGDPVQCAVAVQQLEMHCKLAAETNPALDVGKSMIDGTDSGNTDNPAKVSNRKQVDMSVYSPSGISSNSASSSCLSDVSFSFVGSSISLPISQLCPLLAFVGDFFLALSMIGAARIVAGV